MSKHTPGQWKSASADNVHFSVHANGCRTFASVRIIPDVGSGLANTHLITAAPDLLDACQEALAQYEEFYGPQPPGPVYQKLKKAVERAVRVASKPNGSW